MVAQLARTAVPGSQHNVLVTVDYGMDGVDYLNNVIINATELQPSIFNAVCTSITLYYCHIVLLLGELLSNTGLLDLAVLLFSVSFTHQTCFPLDLMSK